MQLKEWQISKPRKTYKREVAVALFLWLGYLSLEGNPNVVEMVVWPVFTFGIAAFGLDASSKQLQWNPKLPDGRGTTGSG